MAKQLNSASAQVNMVFTADASQAKAEIASLQKDLSNLTTNSFKDMGVNSQVSKATAEVTRLKSILTDAVGETGKLDLSKFTKGLSQSGMSIGSVANSLNSLGGSGQAAFAKLASSILKAEMPLKQTNNLITEMKNTLVNSARWTIASSAIKMISSGISNAYSYAQDLNKSLTDIRIVSGKSADDMARFAVEANKAAKALNTTTGRYADASLIYYQQGLTESAVKERTDITTKMSNVTGQSAETVSSQLTAVWNNFDDGSKSLEYFADVMVKLGAYTASSSDEISTGLQKFAPIAKTIGLSYEYAASALATLTATTRESADSVGTALKSIFSRLQGLKLGETLDDGTDLNKYSKALAVVGVDIKTANGELKDMDTILDELASKWDTLSNAQKVALANTVGGQQRYTQFMSLMNNWDYMQELVDVSKASGGTLDQQASIYAESWDAATAKVRASLEGLWQNLIDDKFFIGATNALGDLIDKITALSTGLGGLPGILSLVANSLMKTFGPEIATSVNNMVDNFMVTSEFGKGKMAGDKMSAVNKLVDMTQNSTKIGEAERQSSLAGYTAQQRMTKTMLGHQDDWTKLQFDQAGGLLDSVRASTQKTKEVAAEKDETDLQTSKNEFRRENRLDQRLHNLQPEIDQRMMDLQQVFDDDSLPIEKRLQAYDNSVKLTEAKQGWIKENMQMALANSDLNGRLGALSLDAYKFADGKGSDQDFDIFKNSILRMLGDETKDADYTGGVQAAVKDLREAVANNNKEAIYKAFDEIGNETNGFNKDTVTDYGDILSLLGYDTDAIDKEKENLTQDLTDREESSRKWAKADIENDAQIRSVEEAMGKIQAPKASIGEAFAAISQGATGAFQAVLGFKGAIEALNNEDMSFGDKFIAATGGIIQGTSGVADAVSGFGEGFKDLANLGIFGKGQGLDQYKQLLNWADGDKNLAGQMLSTLSNFDTAKGKAQDLADALTKMGASGVEAGQAMAMAGNATGIANASFLATAASIAGIVIILGSLIALAYLVAKAWDEQRNSAQKNYEAQSQKLQQLQSDYNSLTEAVNNFKSAASNYSECVAALEELKQGTLEYREAVLAANDAAQELLTQYPGLEYSIGSNGLIKIDDNAIEKAQEDFVSQSEAAAGAMYLQQAKVRDAGFAAEAEDIFNELWDNNAQSQNAIRDQASTMPDPTDEKYKGEGGNTQYEVDVNEWRARMDQQASDIEAGATVLNDSILKEFFTRIFADGKLNLNDFLNDDGDVKKNTLIAASLFREQYGQDYDADYISTMANLLSNMDAAAITELFNNADLVDQQQQGDYQLAATNRFTQDQLYGEDAEAIPEDIKADYAVAVGEAYAGKIAEQTDLKPEDLKDWAQNKYAKQMGYDTSQIKTVKDDDGNESYQFYDKRTGQIIEGSEVSAAYLQGLYKDKQVEETPTQLMDNLSIDEYWRDQIKSQFPTNEGQTYSEVGKQIYGENFNEDSTENNDVMQMVANLLSKGVGLDKITGLGLESEKLQEFLEYLASGEWSSVEDLVNKITELGGD